MRKAAVATFFVGLVTYPVAFHFTTRPGTWLIGRALSVISVLLLVTSVVLAFTAPPSRERKRMWWAVPATVVAIAIIYFDWIGFGFAL